MLSEVPVVDIICSKAHSVQITTQNYVKTQHSRGNSVPRHNTQTNQRDFSIAASTKKTTTKGARHTHGATHSPVPRVLSQSADRPNKWKSPESSAKRWGAGPVQTAVAPKAHASLTAVPCQNHFYLYTHPTTVIMRPTLITKLQESTEQGNDDPNDRASAGHRTRHCPGYGGPFVP